jgi:hypothetical protein
LLDLFKFYHPSYLSIKTTSDHRNTMFTNFVALAAGLAATASAFECHGPYFSFYNRNGPAMSYQRLDPALFNGQMSPHMHSFDGGNGLGLNTDFAALQGSTCTSARIKPDKSLYWRPELYFQNSTGFYKVPEMYLKTYYKFGDAGNVKASVSEFPEGFRMMGGDPYKRADDGNNPGGIKWSCISDSGRIDTVGFPTGFTSCNQGFATELTFPACWNGNDIDPKNPNAHMAYPTNNGKGVGACPDTHNKARFPTIFIEFWYDISSFTGSYGATDMPWVLAQGDPTGYGWHADFMNGWEKGVLAKATADDGYCNCGCGCGTDQMKVCFGADQVNEDEDPEFKTCSTVSGEEAKSGPIQQLPGCNPLQAGPARATPVTGGNCGGTTAPTGSPKASSAAASASASAILNHTVTARPYSPSSVVTSVAHASSALPALSLSLPNKAGDNGFSYGNAKPTTLASVIAAGSSASA